MKPTWTIHDSMVPNGRPSSSCAFRATTSWWSINRRSFALGTETHRAWSWFTASRGTGMGGQISGGFIVSFESCRAMLSGLLRLEHATQTISI